MAALARPRRILVMVKAGPAVDAVLEELAGHLDEGDLLIDGGNSYFEDTVRREQAWRPGPAVPRAPGCPGARRGR